LFVSSRFPVLDSERDLALLELMSFDEVGMDYKGGCVIPLRALRTGYRVFPLVNEKGVSIAGSHVLCEVRWQSLRTASQLVREDLRDDEDAENSEQEKQKQKEKEEGAKRDESRKEEGVVQGGGDSAESTTEGDVDNNDDTNAVEGSSADGADSITDGADLQERFQQLASVLRHGGLYSRQLKALENAGGESEATSLLGSSRSSVHLGVAHK
jgi:hypothetical protein